MGSWEQFSSSIDGFSPERKAVLLVGAGTSVSPADIAALRRLTLLGQLYLVSADAQLLSFLVQRIYSQTNIICRLAKDSSSLPTLLRDTLVEASGGQQLAIAKTSQVLEGKCLSYCTFDVTSCDRALTIRLQFPAQYGPRVELYRADQVPILLTAESEIPGIQTIVGADFLQFDCQLDQAMVGRWKLLLRQVGLEDVCRIRVWAWSDLGINIMQKLLPSHTEEQLEFLITVSGTDGTTLSRIQGQPRLMYETAELASIQTESDRPIDITATEPRSGNRLLTHEASRDIQATELGTVLSISSPTTGGIALDVPLWVEGVDPQGDRFTRLIRYSVIHLEPRSQWRQRLQEVNELSAMPLLTPANIIEVVQDAGEIVALRLQRGDRIRSVLVTSAVLKHQLAWLQTTLMGQPWLVAVLGQELYGLYRCLK